MLFICSRNRKRSPTAEVVFGDRADLEVASAGLAADAEEVARRFGPHLRQARIVCLNIEDDYGFMDEALVELLRSGVTPHLRR